MNCRVNGSNVDVNFFARHYLTMNVEKIRRRLSGGFRPFVLRTSGGHEYQIPHPEFIALSKNEVVVVNSNQDIDILDPLHIVSIKLIKPQGKAASKA
jgi:hypothetical protein